MASKIYRDNESRSSSIDGAWFGKGNLKLGIIKLIDNSLLGFAHAFLAAFPEHEPEKGPLKWISRYRGFRLVGKKGSTYEIKYDNKGNAINKVEIDYK